MKNLIIFCCALLFVVPISAQGEFDRGIAEISSELSTRLTAKDKKKVVVLYITEINKATTIAGKYIADLISINIVNDPNNFEVFDRENLSGIAEAKKLIAEGYIDAAKAQELGKLLAVQTIIVGNYTVLNTTMKLTIKALDVNSGFVIAAAMKDLPLDKNAEALLGVNFSQENINSQSPNLGFNDQPLNSNEHYNNPATVNSDCKEKKSGDYCFFHSRKDTTFYIQLIPNGAKGDTKWTMTLTPGQTQCFYELPVGVYNYWIKFRATGAAAVQSKFSGGDGMITHLKGQITVNQCRSKTYTIR